MSLDDANDFASAKFRPVLDGNPRGLDRPIQASRQ